LKVGACFNDINGNRLLEGRGKSKDPIEPLCEQQVYASKGRVETIHKVRWPFGKGKGKGL
jgi:hypothetical protein